MPEGAMSGALPERGKGKTYSIFFYSNDQINIMLTSLFIDRQFVTRKRMTYL